MNIRNMLRHAAVASIQIEICASTQDILRVAAQLQASDRPLQTSSDGWGLGQQSLRERAQALACTITTDVGATASEFRVSRSNAT